MHLYSLTLCKATAINQACSGSFTGPDTDEICTAKGKIIELLKVDKETGQLEIIHTQEMFGIIRSIMKFRLIGMQKDYLVIGSDSGRVVILEYDANKGHFIKLI